MANSRTETGRCRRSRRNKVVGRPIPFHFRLGSGAWPDGNSQEFAVLDREMPRVKNGKYIIVHTRKEANCESEDNTNAKLWLSYLQDFLQSLTSDFRVAA
jgi:hypothetical protein